MNTISIDHLNPIHLKKLFIIHWFICAFCHGFFAKTERAQLQETVNRLEGELAARSDALRKATVDITRMKTKHETELRDKTDHLNESLYQMENKWKEASDENKLLKQKLDSIESKNRIMHNELETVKLSRENLQNEYNHVKDELDKLRLKSESTTVKVSAGIQAVQKSENASTNTENIEKNEMEYLPKLQLSSNN
ncbi:unnamed protein product [Schistosoma curassoni]|uniref:Uncharacterized protein n=1 Tax=Schistosoma curassoni TaxID=6186 RepID=A0A183KZ94_9TREM|nr:unnamed protein product [Schistosoma curassoni]